MPRSVAVVLPTSARPQLVLQAIDSALAQTYPVQEVCVVLDGPDAVTEHALAAFTDTRLKVDVLGSKYGASFARNRGVEMASSELIAFLDDDDTWMPDRLEHEIALLPHAKNFLAFAGVLACDEHGRRASPRRRLLRDESIAEYLFVHKKLLIGGESCAMTSTFILPKATAQQYPFPIDADFHQDWELLMNLEAAQIPIVFVPSFRTFVNTHHGARASISTSTTWRDSLAWAHEHRDQLGERGYAGFCSTVVAFKAHGSLRAFWDITRALSSAKPTFVEVVRTFLQLTVPRSARAWFHHFLARRRAAHAPPPA